MYYLHVHSVSCIFSRLAYLLFPFYLLLKLSISRRMFLPILLNSFFLPSFSFLLFSCFIAARLLHRSCTPLLSTFSFLSDCSNPSLLLHLLIQQRYSISISLCLSLHPPYSPTYLLSLSISLLLHLFLPVDFTAASAAFFNKLFSATLSK